MDKTAGDVDSEDAESSVDMSTFVKVGNKSKLIFSGGKSILGMQGNGNLVRRQTEGMHRWQKKVTFELSKIEKMNQKKIFEQEFQ